ncbi:MAG: helix-turn-helix domain-containing protein [Raoultibacter sp.]|jgi:AraC-like DNA-binding protein
MQAGSPLEPLFGPFLHMLTGTQSPASDSSCAGELWRVDADLGRGYVWYYPINDVMAVTITDVEYHKDVLVAYEVPDFFCFGKHNRNMSSYFFNDSQKYQTNLPVDSKIIGYTWKQSPFKETVRKNKHYCVTGISLLPEAVAMLGARFTTNPFALGSAIAELDGAQFVPGIDELFTTLFKLRPGTSSAPIFYESKVLEACALLVDWWENKQSPASVSIRPVDRSALNITLNYIEKHLDEPLRLDTLCKISCMSASKLSGLFKLTKGQTPMEYVREQRMEQACKLLGGSDIPLGELASKLGFSHQGSFSEAFKAVYGVSPLAYRKNYSRSQMLTYEGNPLYASPELFETHLSTS